MGNYWNLLPDGSILDATADQFGEGNSVRLILPDNTEYARYHPRFPRDVDYDNDDEINRLVDLDNERYAKSMEYRKQHGEGWWLNDKTRFDKYNADRR